MPHKLSITIPSYRQPEALIRALQALDAQTFKNFDVIIIDDNSGTDLNPIMDEFSKRLDISLLRNEHNLGAMKNMMKSIILPTQSDYVFSHHEDDYIQSDYLEHAVRLLDTHPKLSFVVSSAIWVKSDEKFELSEIGHIPHRTLTFEEFLRASLERTPFIFGSVVYRRKDLWGEFDLTTYHTLCDKIFMAEILRHNASSCAYIPSPAIYVHDHSLDAKDTRSHGATIEHIINYFTYYKKHLPSTSAGKRLITNASLLGYAQLPGKPGFITFLKAQKRFGLVSFFHINRIGVYSLISIFLSPRYMNPLITMIKKTK